MPTYEYLCKQCGENFDVHQSFSDKPLKRHATCGGELQKVFHARGIVFRGSGFYATDGKPANSTDSPKERKAKAEAGKSSDGAATKTPSKSSSSSDT